MATFDVSLADLPGRIKKDMAARERRIKRAVKKTAKTGVTIVKEHVPVAFGEIEGSVHTEGSAIVIDAPHAAASNNGSRPHRPPVQPLIEYMELRGASDPVAAGWALAAKIAREGTKPSHFADNSLPEIVETLSTYVAAAMNDDAEEGAYEPI